MHPPRPIGAPRTAMTMPYCSYPALPTSPPRRGGLSAATAATAHAGSGEGRLGCVLNGGPANRTHVCGAGALAGPRRVGGACRASSRARTLPLSSAPPRRRRGSTGNPPPTRGSFCGGCGSGGAPLAWHEKRHGVREGVTLKWPSLGCG